MGTNDPRVQEAWANDGWDSGESLLTRACEVVAVAGGVGLLLGGLAGVITGLGGPVAVWLIGGAILGATLGGLLESDHLLG